MTDWRALCAELFELVEDEYSGTSIWAEWRRDIRAALAQPEPVGPTDAEIMELWTEWNLGWDPRLGPVVMPHPREFARAVLARWGNVNTNQQHD